VDARHFEFPSAPQDRKQSIDTAAAIDPPVEYNDAPKTATQTSNKN
jgi:hypothetical protein